MFTEGDKSRHSMFSESSDLDHHPVRTHMPRENMSGDSRVWLLRNQQSSIISTEQEQTNPDKIDGTFGLRLC